MGVIIWIAVIFYIVWRMNKNNKKNAPGGNGARPQNGQTQQAGGPVQSEWKQPQSEWKPSQSGRKQPQSDRRPSQSDQRQSQAELKRRLKERYGTPKNPKGRQPDRAAGPQQTGRDILSRARDNVAEDFSDNAAEERDTCRYTADMPDDCDLMREVQELIVTGYQPRLPGQRDFLAEAQNMLAGFVIGDDTYDSAGKQPPVS